MTNDRQRSDSAEGTKQSAKWMHATERSKIKLALCKLESFFTDYFGPINLEIGWFFIYKNMFEDPRKLPGTVQTALTSSLCTKYIHSAHMPSQCDT